MGITDGQTCRGETIHGNHDAPRFRRLGSIQDAFLCKFGSIRFFLVKKNVTKISRKMGKNERKWPEILRQWSMIDIISSLINNSGAFAA